MASTLPLALILISLSCALPFGGQPTPTPSLPTATATIPPTPTATPQPLPPALVESSPPPGVEVPLEGPLTLYFNQSMDHSSVESSLTNQLGQSMNFTWPDDGTVVIYPSEPLPPATDLKFNIGAGVRSLQGLEFSGSANLSYTTAGYLRLSQTLPEKGSPEIDPTSAVVTAFNRPVVPLGADPASLPEAFSLDPPAQGRGEWLNTSTYAFYPEPPLAGGSTYTVNMNPALKSSDGSPLQDTQPWTFSTAFPRLLTIEPVAETPWPLDPEVRLTFNQPMDSNSVEASFSLLGPGGQPVAGSSEWNEDHTEYTFTPAVLLNRGATYTVGLGFQAQALGGTALGEPVQVPVTTSPELFVARTLPTSGGSLDPNGSLALFFSAPIRDEDVLAHVSFDPQVPNLDYWWSEDELALRLYGNFTPSAPYNLVISPELVDEWGGGLREPFNMSFTTAPLRQEVLILPGGDANFLTLQDSSIVAQVTNVFNMPITVGSVPPGDFFNLLGPQGFELRQAYKGPDPRSWVQALDIPPDRSQAVDIPLTPDGSQLAPGLYYLRIDPLGGDFFGGPYMLVASNLQVTYKVSATDALVWAVDSRSNTAIVNATVILYSESGVELGRGQTDEGGVFKTTFAPLDDPYSITYAVIGQPGEEFFGMALSSWSQGVDPWSFGITLNREAPGLYAYLYTDRPIYRPGQTVYFRGVVREAYNGRYSPPQIASLPLTITGDQGEELVRFDLPLSAFGTVHGEFPLPSNVRPGSYWMSSSESLRSGVGFQVANYRKPEINLQVGYPSDQIQSGQTLEAMVEARYFFDAPAGNVDVEWALYTKPSSFSLPGYRVGLEEAGWLDAFRIPSFQEPLGELVEEGESQTSPDGTLTLSFPTETSPDRQLYTLEVTATDESGLPVSARASAQVNPASYYIGVKPDVWFGRAGDSTGFEVMVADWEKEPAGVRQIRAEFKQIAWTREDPSSAISGEQPRFVPQYTLVASTDFSTSAEGLARLAFVPPGPGTYQLDLIGQEGVRTELILWVGGSGQARWPDMPNSRLRLTADRDSYLPGDTAQVFVPNPFNQDVPVLITLERGVILSHQTTTLGMEGQSLSLPLTGEHSPNAFLSITLLGRDSQGRPDFRQGYLNIPVEPVEQTLNVDLISLPQRAGPGDQVIFSIRVSDDGGNPVQGEFSLSVVDLAALALADPNAPDITTAFYSQQPIGVNTSLALAASTQRLFYSPLGAGGGGGGIEAAIVVRESFPDTAYWNAEIVTGPDGTAQVTVELPDTLTTWQVDLRGATQETRVGEADTAVITSKDLLIRPVTPRFLVVGDRAQLAAVVQNNTAVEMQVEVELKAESFELEDSSPRQVSVTAGGRARLEWWGVALDASQADLVFSAQGRGASGEVYHDAARPVWGVLPVLRYLASQAFSTAGVMDEGGEILQLVSMPRSFVPQGGELNIELSPSLASAMLKALDVLEHSPYESNEETLSRFLPNLETYRVLGGFGLGADELKARLDRTLVDGLLLLQARQNFDGGWGWWLGGESDPYISAYILFGLHRARQAGIDVEGGMFQRAVDYLQAGLEAVGVGDYSAMETWQLDRLAFENYALLEAGAGSMDHILGLFLVRDRLSPWAQALLALSSEGVSPGSSEASEIFNMLESSAIRSASGAHWEMAQDEAGLLSARRNMHTTLSNSAVVIFALASHDPGSPLLADAVRYLMSNRGAEGAWASSYTTSWTLIAMAQVIQGTGELGGEFSFSAVLNGAPIARGQAGGAEQLTPVSVQVPDKDLFPDYPNALVIQRDPGQGRLYYSAALSVSRAVAEVAPLSAGMSIERAFYPVGEDCPQGECAPLSFAQTGGSVTARLTLTLPEDVYYLVVEDYIPAGAEILDTRLKTSQIGEGQEPEAQVLFDPRDPFAGGWGWWLFHEAQIYDDHIAWGADYLPAGVYELTYTLVILQPGLYHVLPARAWAYYFPELQANSAGVVFEIKP